MLLTAALLRRVPFEAFVWAAGLTALALTDPAAAPLLRLCPFDHVGAWLGVRFCPGCGLGHSVAHLFRGDLRAALAAHPLGPFAVAVLLHRIGALVRTAVRPSPVPLHVQDPPLPA